jgi:hypothetical protein
MAHIASSRLRIGMQEVCQSSTVLYAQFNIPEQKPKCKQTANSEGCPTFTSFKYIENVYVKRKTISPNWNYMGLVNLVSYRKEK